LTQPLLKEFLQAITHFNLNIFELVVQGILMLIIEKTDGRNVLFTPIWYYQNIGQLGQGK
jgi:hypothetical protein